MNSYPLELLAQHVPLMFVAGLTEGLPPDTPSSPVTIPSNAVVSPKSLGPSSSVDISADHPSAPPTEDELFLNLTARLRSALTYRKKGVIWDPNRSKAFHIVLVDKAVRFPPRKIYPGSGRESGSQQGTPRSPLSPLTPSSPVYPDGLITPIWIRKHVELVPSVFVLFLRLPEDPRKNDTIDEARDEATTKEDERQRDAELSAEIAARKKITAERGVKLTVVLLASRKLLDDPLLDQRLSFIRRQSGLDSRAALFVLSPVSSTELNDFVKSLQSALHEPAVEYYTAHFKRVRRKRNKHSHSNHASISGVPTTSPAQSAPRPLRSVGWTVRYEYKSALFAEFRMEEELARRHYETCWMALVEMFGSTAVLPPRTKRWAEAKVLADCIAVKLAKLYLYHGEPHIALATFNRHVQKFAELSRGWGIGEETFEFWSWMAKSYRIFGELVELALRAGYKLPIPVLPSSRDGAILPTVASGTTPPLEPNMLGTSPANVLQHPGYYFYTAANCTQRRYERFLGVLEQEEKQSGVGAQSPGFSTEKKVEHSALIVDLFTKAYELFKRYRTGQSRQTYYIAYRIAETYYSAGKYESAIRFFDRIAKTYRREHWGPIYRSILLMWYDCARHLSDVELTVKLLLELLAPGVTKDVNERATLADDLGSILQNSHAPSDNVLTIKWEDYRSILCCSMVFLRKTIFIGEIAPFQVSITAPPRVSIAGLTFSSLRLFVNGRPQPSIIVNHLDEGHTTHIDLGTVIMDGGESPPTKSGNLRWSAGGTTVLSGSMLAEELGDLTISSVTFIIYNNGWSVELPIDMSSDMGAEDMHPVRWLKSKEGPPSFLMIKQPKAWICKVVDKPHRLLLNFVHAAPAYLGERYPITIEVSNADEREFDVVVDILLQPSEDESVNKIFFGEQESTALIKGVSFGSVLPGQSSKQTMFLTSAGSAGDRILDVSFQTKLVGSASSSTVSTSEANESLPYRHNPGPLTPHMDLTIYAHGHFSPHTRAVITSQITNRSKWDLEVMNIVWVAKDVQGAKMVNTSTETHESLNVFPLELSQGDSYSVIAQVDIDVEDLPFDRKSMQMPCPGNYAVKWRRLNSEEWSTSIFALSPLSLPSDDLIGILIIPPSSRLHQPFVISLHVQNRNMLRTADLLLQTESLDAFVVAGPKTCRLPTLLPGSSVEVKLSLVPMLCGHRKLPNFKIMNRRQRIAQPPSNPPTTDAQMEDTVVLEPVPIVDETLDARSGDGTNLLIWTKTTDAGEPTEARKEGVTMLVTP